MSRFNLADLKKVQEAASRKLAHVTDPIEGGKLMAKELSDLVDDGVVQWSRQMIKQALITGMMLKIPPEQLMADLFLMGLKLGVGLADENTGSNHLATNLKFMAR